ncbi:hypothetical protein ABFX02_03G037300 [Erythranthe guttata]
MFCRKINRNLLIKKNPYALILSYLLYPSFSLSPLSRSPLPTIADTSDDLRHPHLRPSPTHQEPTPTTPPPFADPPSAIRRCTRSPHQRHLIPSPTPSPPSHLHRRPRRIIETWSLLINCSIGVSDRSPSFVARQCTLPVLCVLMFVVANHPFTTTEMDSSQFCHRFRPSTTARWAPPLRRG